MRADEVFRHVQELGTPIGVIVTGFSCSDWNMRYVELSAKDTVDSDQDFVLEAHFTRLKNSYLEVYHCNVRHQGEWRNCLPGWHVEHHVDGKRAR